MAKKKVTPRKIVKRVQRSGPGAKEAERLAEIREQAKKDFPPAKQPRLKPATEGIAAQLREAREAQGLTWYAVAKRAGVPNPATIRDIEYGRDVKLSNLEAVAAALGMQVLAAAVEA